jgi:subtilase family serine protease
MFHRARLHDFGLIAMLAGLGVFASAYGCGSQGSSKAQSSGATTTQSTPPAKPAFAALERNLHPLARPENDIGPLDPSKRLPKLSLFFKLTPQQRHDRDALLEAQQDPTSPSYHKWLTPQDYAARFGASPDVIAKTTSWLAAQGFEVHDVSPLGARVTFAGSVSAVQNAFQTEIHRYQVGTETHFAMAKAPSIPSELADAVGGLYGTHDFYPRRTASKILAVTPEAACPTGSCTGKAIAPADWANIYDVAPLYTTGIGGSAVTGAGVTIAIIGEAQVSQSDVNAFRTRFGLPASTVTFTPTPGTGAAAAGYQGWGQEGALDVEWSGAVAQGATINFVYAGSEDPNADEAAFYAIESNLAPIISESFGTPEAAYLQGGYMTTDGDLLEFYGSAASLEGITFIAAAGDSGATTGFNFGIAGLYVGMNASLPGVTGVGGTEFPTGSLTYSGTNTTQTAYSTSEEVWNESDNPSSKYGLAAGGGGISSLFPRPSYQSSLTSCSSSTTTMVGTLPISGVNASAMRQVPDISFTAAAGNNPILIECEYATAANDCTGAGNGVESVIAIGGTSASAPSFAGVVALIEQATGGHRLGNINPTLYAIASSSPTAFHDITTGNNEIECTAGTDPGCGTGNLYGFAAATGYDCASGIGSADVNKLASAWATLTPTATTLTPTPSTATLGQPPGHGQDVEQRQRDHRHRDVRVPVVPRERLDR